MALRIDDMLSHRLSSYINCHNITNLLGWLALQLPFGEPAYRANLLVALVGALTVSILYMALYQLYESQWTAAISAGLIMISHSLWWNSTLVESYAVNALFTALAIYFSVRIMKSGRVQDHIPLAFVSGLCVFNHVETGFLCVGWLACVVLESWQDRLPTELFWRAVGAFALGLAPWLTVFCIDWLRIGAFGPTFKQAFFGPFSTLFFASSLAGNMLHYALLLFTEYPNGYFLLGFAGLVLLWRRFRWKGPLVGLIITCATNGFAVINMDTWNRFCHMLPSLVLLGFFGSAVVDAGVRVFQRTKDLRWRSALGAAAAASLLYPPYFYSKLSTWGRNPSSVWYPQYSMISTPCFRTNDLIANPNKRGFTDYQDYVDALFRALPRDAMYLDDDSRGYYTVVDYNQKVLGRRPDIRPVLINSFGYDDAAWGETPIDLARVIVRAYADDRPLYMISQSWPFSRALGRLPGSERFGWEPFPVGDRCSIFRLKTERENPDPSNYRPDLRPLLSERLIVSGKGRQVFNIDTSHVNLEKDLSLQMQDTRQFGNAWLRDDQLLMYADGPGSWVEFIVESPAARDVAMTLILTTSWDFGVVEAWLDEQPLARVDLYATTVWVKRTDPARVRLRAGANHLVLRVAGKNPRSTGYGLAIDALEVDPAAGARKTELRE